MCLLLALSVQPGVTSSQAILAAFFTHFSCGPASNDYMKTRQIYSAAFPMHSDRLAHEMIELPVY